MAKVTFSGIGVTEANGKSGNKVFTRNRGGHVTRQWVIPVNTITPRRTALWDAFTNISQLWQTLSDEDRLEWELYSKNFPRIGRLGARYFKSGFNQFMQTAFNILVSGGVPMPLPPLPVRPEIITGASIDLLTSTDLDITLTIASGGLVVPPDNVFVISGTTSVSAGIMYKRSGFRGFKTSDPAGALSGSAFLDYTDEFPAPVSGAKIFFKVWSIHQISGIASQPFFFTGIVA